MLQRVFCLFWRLLEYWWSTGKRTPDIRYTHKVRLIWRHEIWFLWLCVWTAIWFRDDIQWGAPAKTSRPTAQGWSRHTTQGHPSRIMLSTQTIHCCSRGNMTKIDPNPPLWCHCDTNSALKLCFWHRWQDGDFIDVAIFIFSATISSMVRWTLRVVFGLCYQSGKIVVFHSDLRVNGRL